MQSLNKLKSAINQKFGTTGFSNLFEAFKWHTINDPGAKTASGQKLFQELKRRMQDI